LLIVPIARMCILLRTVVNKLAVSAFVPNTRDYSGRRAVSSWQVLFRYRQLSTLDPKRLLLALSRSSFPQSGETGFDFLFSDAEIPENIPKDLVSGYFTGDLTKIVNSLADIRSYKVFRNAGLQAFLNTGKTLRDVI
jgi:hypothetical protein